MCTLEAALVVQCSIHRYLLNWIHGFVATNAFLSCSTKHIRNFGSSRSLSLQRPIRFPNLWCPFEAFLKTSSSLEVLIEMWSAVENSFKGVVIAKLTHQEEEEEEEETEQSNL